jgi:hypothetical protein
MTTALCDPITGQPITAAELQAEIALLQLRAAASPNEQIERVYLQLAALRAALLSGLETIQAQEEDPC